jgi:hypothetical protein
MSDSENKAPDLQQSYPPPVDFRFLVASFVGQAMSSMGKLQNPLTGKTEVNLPWARYFIDVLGMLEEKTKGNLDAAEAADLASQLSMLRLTYVDTQKQEVKEDAEEGQAEQS